MHVLAHLLKSPATLHRYFPSHALTAIEQAIEAEAQAQAICMQTGDFRRAYEAFVARAAPRFEGN